MLGVIMLSGRIWFIIELNALMLSVFMANVVMLSVVAPIFDCNVGMAGTLAYHLKVINKLLYKFYSTGLCLWLDLWQILGNSIEQTANTYKLNPCDKVVVETLKGKFKQLIPA